MSEALFDYRRDGEIAHLEVSAAGPAPAESALESFEAAVGAFEADEAARALVLQVDGEPPLGPVSGRAACAVRHGRRVQDALRRLRSGDRPVFAAVSGRLESAGCAFAWTAHVVVAAAGAWLRPGPQARGSLDGFGGLHRLARRVGAGRAAALVILGEPLSAATAREAGLVDLVAEPGGQVELACAAARRCLEVPRPALAAALEILAVAAELEEDDAGELEAQLAGLAAARPVED